MIEGTEEAIQLTFKINSNPREQEFEWKTSIANVVVALQCTILPLDCVAFLTKER